MVSMNNEDRIEIWRALSDLFLDTEITDTTYEYIARTIDESGLSLTEAENILWYEVYPVLEKNLRSMTGVWDGWSDAWLLEHLSKRSFTGAIGGKSSIKKEITASWLRVLEVLSKEE